MEILRTFVMVSLSIHHVSILCQYTVYHIQDNNCNILWQWFLILINSLILNVQHFHYKYVFLYQLYCRIPPVMFLTLVYASHVIFNLPNDSAHQLAVYCKIVLGRTAVNWQSSTCSSVHFCTTILSTSPNTISWFPIGGICGAYMWISSHCC